MKYNPKIGDLLFFDGTAQGGPMFGMVVDIHPDARPYPYRIQWVDGQETIETNNDYKDICYHRRTYLSLRKKNGL